MPKRKHAPSCPPRTAVAYARYSSAGQRDVSIDQQLHDIRAFAQREGYTIVHEYADRAKSGFKNSAARHEFQAMLSAAKNGKFDTVLAWKVDRFGRNRRESAIYKGQLQDVGVSVVYTQDHIPAGAAGVLTEGMLESLAEWYSRNLSENVNRGMRDNALKGISNGTQILGYRRGEDGHYQIDENEASIVRMIFEKYLAGFSAGSIARLLNASDIHTARGKAFNTSNVLRVINNECYTGIYIWGDIRIPGGMPVIISEDDWRRAQEMKKKIGRHYEAENRVDFLLTGKVFCGLCGKPMVGDSGKSHTGTTYYYYSCTGHKQKSGAKRTCEKKSVRKDYLEKKVLDFVYDQCLTGPERETIADIIMFAQKENQQSSPLFAMRQELKETDDKADRMVDAIEQGIWNDRTAARMKELEERAKHLRAEIAELEYKEAQLLNRDRILFFLGKMAEYNREDPERQAQLIYTFINAVFVYPDMIKIVVNAIEGNSTISLDDLEADGTDNGTSASDGSDNAALGLLNRNPLRALILKGFRLFCPLSFCPIFSKVQPFFLSFSENKPSI